MDLENSVKLKTITFFSLVMATIIIRLHQGLI